MRRADDGAEDEGRHGGRRRGPRPCANDAPGIRGLLYSRVPEAGQVLDGEDDGQLRRSRRCGPRGDGELLPAVQDWRGGRLPG